MMRRLVESAESFGAWLASRLKTVTLTVAPARFTFATARRAATIDTAVRVAPNGQIVGFGEASGSDEGRLLPLFPSDVGDVDERVMQSVCRRGLALALGPWVLVRPRVVVHGAERVRVPREVFVRVLRGAGASAVEFAD